MYGVPSQASELLGCNSDDGSSGNDSDDVVIKYKNCRSGSRPVISGGETVRVSPKKDRRVRFAEVVQRHSPDSSYMCPDDYSRFSSNFLEWAWDRSFSTNYYERGDINFLYETFFRTFYTTVSVAVGLALYGIFLMSSLDLTILKPDLLYASESSAIGGCILNLLHCSLRYIIEVYSGVSNELLTEVYSRYHTATNYMLVDMLRFTLLTVTSVFLGASILGSPDNQYNSGDTKSIMNSCAWLGSFVSYLLVECIPARVVVGCTFQGKSSCKFTNVERIITACDSTGVNLSY